MNMRRPLTTFVSLIIGAALAAPVFTAAPAVQAAGDCALDAQFQALQDIQGHPLASYGDNVKAELAARKNVLNAVIDCAAGEIGPLKTSVAAASADDQNIKATQARFLSKFDEASGYYRFQKSRVNDMGIEGTKQLSREIKEWRTATYEPLSQQATNFIIWTKNQTILGNAENRFGQIKRTLELLKLTDDPAIQDLLRSADSDFGAANDANDRARDALIKFNAPDDSSLAIKTTLNSLAVAYQAFFDIAAALGKK